MKELIAGLFKKFFLTTKYTKPTFVKATVGKRGSKGTKLKPYNIDLCGLCEKRHNCSLAAALK
jgi:hypothetical protein